MPVNRRQPLLGGKSPEEARRGVGEVAGETAAECTAICCFFPCVVVKLVVLAAYKVPTGLCRRMMKKKKELLQQQQQSESSSKVGLNYESETEGSDGEDADGDGPTPAVDFEAGMWDRFYGAGFWRSPSQREE
ncbi:uncharacterized protein LOC130792364 [Actinidia eriantha]|uniref:uncharacterized protein LOC130792364 n=1 Tax=Actinidia eriantha TaxID=165200 RepID=UPI0025908C4C|nr:uncharacterized protein LOC130792364 [Actinidia eriantha]